MAEAQEYLGRLETSLTPTTITVQTNGVPVIPEPASLILLGFGTLSILGAVWRRKAAT